MKVEFVVLCFVAVRNGLVVSDRVPVAKCEECSLRTFSLQSRGIKGFSLQSIPIDKKEKESFETFQYFDLGVV